MPSLISCETLKNCKTCQVPKSQDSFYFRKSGTAELTCKTCRNLSNKLYRYSNEDTVKAAKKAYSEVNKEKLNQTSKLWDEENHDRKLENISSWAKSNPEKRRGYKAKRRSIKSQATPPWLTDSDKKLIQELYIQAKNMAGNFHVDHVIPLVHPLVCGLNVLANLKIVEAKVNLKKGASFTPYIESEVN